MTEEKREQSRDRQIVRASLVGVGANVLLAAFKAFAGLLAHSIAIVLDALNNLSDALSSVITIVGMKLAALPADKKHPFGHGRAEYLSAILIAGLVLAAGVSALVESVKKIFHPEPADYSVLTLVIVAAAIVVKLLLGRYTQRVGRATKSDSLIASGADATFDAVISAGTLAGALVTMASGYVIDGWIGCVISVVILKAGLEMLLDTLSSIVGRRADTQLAQELKTRLCSIDGILGAYDLVLHNYGPTRAMGSVNVAVYDWHTAADLHALSKKAQALIWEEYRIYLYIGFYAVNTHDDALRVLEDQVRGGCKAYPEVLSIHAFFENQETGTISFDAVVDFACRDSLALIHRMEEELAAKHPGRRFAIKIDRAYSD